MESEKTPLTHFGRTMSYSTASRPAFVNNKSATQPTQPADKQHNHSKTVDLLDALVSVSLIGLFFGLPLLFTGLTFQGIAFEKQIYFYFWLLIGLIAWSSKGVILGELRIRRTPLDIPILLFWTFYGIASIFSVDRWHSFWGFFGDPSHGFISITALILAFYFILSHFTVKRFQMMFWSLVASGFAILLWSFLALEQIHFMPTSFEKYAPLSLLGTISNLGIFFALLLPLFLTALFSLWQDSAVKNIYRKVVTGVLLFGIALTLFLILALFPFISWSVVLGGFSFFLVYILAQIVRPNERWVFVPMVVFVLLLGFLMIGNYQLNLTRATLPVEVTPGTTLSWQVAKESLKEHFFAGVGTANYSYAFSLFYPKEHNLDPLYSVRFYQGTGLFFEALSTIGALGTILFLLLWLSFFSVGVYLLSYEKNRNKLYSLGLWSMVTMLFLASFTSAINGSLLLIGVLIATLALGTVFWESDSEEKYIELSLKATPKFALALAFTFMVVSAGVAFLFVFMGKVFVADMNMGKAVRISAEKPNTDSLEMFAKAINIYPQEGRYYMRLAQEYMALANVEASKPEREQNVSVIRDYAEQAIDLSQIGKKQMPNDVVQAESMGMIYENIGLYDSATLTKAIETYLRAEELEPQNPLYSVKLGQIKKLLADERAEGAEKEALYTESKNLFEKAIEKKQDLAVAYYDLALILSRLKDLDGAVTNAEQALSFENSNLNYGYNLGILYQLRNKDDDKARAEKMFKDILSVNEKLIDVRLSLGLLYEDMNKKDSALAEYNKILTYLPKEADEKIAQTKEQIEKMISNVKSGKSNLNRENESAPTNTPSSVPENPMPVEVPIGAPAPFGQ